MIYFPKNMRFVQNVLCLHVLNAGYVDEPPLNNLNGVK